MSKQYYINPINDYKVHDGSTACWLWPVLFGGLYFAFRGNWSWFFIYALLFIGTLGLSFFVVPFFTRKINRTHLLRKGYKQC